MNDRFKFRCGITISHYDDDGNDIETLLLVNNISIFDDGDVGFNRESLKEAVKRENLSEEEERTLWNSLDEYEVFEDWYQIPADFIEQCTGLKDKKGNLIYEGDLIKSPNNSNLLEIIWEKGVWQTKEYREKGIHELFLYILATEYGVEIVGNIHAGVQMKRLDDGFWYYIDTISEDIIVCRDNCILGHAENEKQALEIIERFKGYKESK